MPSAGVEDPPRDICVRSASVGDKRGLDMMPVTTCRGVLIPSALCGLAYINGYSEYFGIDNTKNETTNVPKENI